MAAANTSEEVDWNPPEEVDWDNHASHSYDLVNGKKVPTGSAEAHAVMSPTSGMSNAELAAAGAGKSQVDLWHGVRQLFGGVTPAEVDETNRLDQPLMKTGAGLAGYAGGAIADAVIPAGLTGSAARAAGFTRTGAAFSGLANPATFGAAAASGAAQGALQPVGTNDSRTWNTVSGAATGAAGHGLAKGASALISAAADPLSQAGNKAAQALIDAGVPLDAAQRTGSMLLNRAKAMLSDNPLTAGAQQDFQDMQGRAFTKAALATIGEKSNAATPQVMLAAKNRIGGVYDDVANRTNIDYDLLEPKLADIENQARIPLDDQQFGKIQRTLNDILQKSSMNGGKLNGEQFSNIKQTLDTLSGGADSDVGEVARDIRQALHQGLTDSATAAGNEADVAKLKLANQQWGNMRKIEGAISKDGEGQIRPAALANTMYQKGNRYVSIYGQGDRSLVDLADAGNALLPNRTPNSGTPSRLIAQFAVPAAIGAGVEGVREGDWKGAAKGAAAGLVIPKLAQAALNSQGQIGMRTMNALGAAGSRTELPELAGGALQKSPWATLLGAEAGLDKSTQESKSKQ